MATNFSTRADILGRVLRHINDGSYLDSEDQLWFGDGLGAPLPTEFLDEGEKLLREIGRDASNYLSQLEAIERTSLGQKRDISTVSPLLRKFLADLTAEQRKSRAGEFARMASSVTPPESSDDEITESLDRHYASEVIEKLEDIARRVTHLGRVSTPVLPNRKVQLVFEEAHRCYLYGFHLACAVCCRSILEMALQETVDPDRRLKRALGTADPDVGSQPRGPTRKSYIIEMAMEAARRKLVPDRIADSTKLIKGAGDTAIHDPDNFSRLYPESKVTDVLLQTRTILEQLYRLRVLE
jgi:hypothetical protein